MSFGFARLSGTCTRGLRSYNTTKVVQRLQLRRLVTSFLHYGRHPIDQLRPTGVDAISFTGIPSLPSQNTVSLTRRRLSSRPNGAAETNREVLLARLKEIESATNLSDVQKQKLFSAAMTDKFVDVAKDMPAPFGRTVEGWKLRRDVVKQLQLAATKQAVIMLEPVAESKHDVDSDFGEKAGPG